MSKELSIRKKETGVDFLEEEINTNNLINKIALSVVVVLSISMLGFLSFFYSSTINPENSLLGFLVSDLEYDDLGYDYIEYNDSSDSSEEFYLEESFVENQYYDDLNDVENIDFPQQVESYETQNSDNINEIDDINNFNNISEINDIDNISNYTNNDRENQLSAILPGTIFILVLVVLFIVIIGLILSKNSNQKNSRNNFETEAILKNDKNNSQINETSSKSINHLTNNTSDTNTFDNNAFDDLKTNIDGDFNSNNNYDFSEEILKEIHEKIDKNKKTDEKQNLTDLKLKNQEIQDNKERSEKEKIERLISLLKMLIEDDDIDIDEKKKHLEKTKGIIETITDQNIKTRLNTIVTVFETILEF